MFNMTIFKAHKRKLENEMNKYTQIDDILHSPIMKITYNENKETALQTTTIKKIRTKKQGDNRHICEQDQQNSYWGSELFYNTWLFCDDEQVYGESNQRFKWNIKYNVNID